MAAGIKFTETMRGFFSAGPADDFAKADEAGRNAGTRLEFTVTIVADSVDQLVSDPAHFGRIAGTVSAPTVSPALLQVESGEFHLLVKDPDRPRGRRMTYDMALRATDGQAYQLHGYKVIHNETGADTWADTTTLFTTLTRGDGTIVGRGILHVEPQDFAKQLTSMSAPGASNPLEALGALAKFGFFFAGELFDVYGLVAGRATELNPDGSPRERRPLKMGAPSVHSVHTADGVELRLTRYRGGSKGPVVLAPGIGTSTLAYAIDTVDTNLPEFLYADGYDVWLFDYRASPALASARTQFTLDDIATKDFPAAIAKVREITGAPDVQVIGHCVGSLTFLMAMIAGLEGVRSGIASQFGLFPDSSFLNRIKGRLDLGTLLETFGVESLTTDFAPDSGADRFIDQVLRLFPTGESCDSAVCRRILGIYGEVFKHTQLNEATHRAVHEMFGVTNVTSFKHLTRMIREGHAVDAKGNDVYMSNLKNLTAPVTFLHGEDNKILFPSGTEKTFRALCDANGPERYSRITIPGYAHMDCFIGKTASKDVYPALRTALHGHDVMLGRA